MHSRHPASFKYMKVSIKKKNGNYRMQNRVRRIKRTSWGIEMFQVVDDSGYKLHARAKALQSVPSVNIGEFYFRKSDF